MKKVFILFLFLFSVGISFSQNSTINADFKFENLLVQEDYVKQLPDLLNLVLENTDRFSVTRTFNAVIVSEIRNNGISTDDEIHRNLRNYFGSTDPAIISESETYLLENL